MIVVDILQFFSNQDIENWILNIIVLGTIFKLGDVLLKKINSRRENVDSDKIAVGTMNEVLQTVVLENTRKEMQLKSLEIRVQKLEERERHMLTRAAVHEAWDQMAFSILLSYNAEHPPPPPLYPPLPTD